MKKTTSSLIAFSLWATFLGNGSVAAAATAASTQAMAGFGSPGASAERDLEKRFDGQLDAKQLREWMKRLTARPHHVGSPYGKEVADFLLAQFRAWGFDAKIEEFRILFPTPKTRVLELTAPTRSRAVLAEPELKEDPTSGQVKEQLPIYNAYSPDGDVEGQLVYVNYGQPKDYEELDKRGLDVKGKIVIARYGQSWRGIKPKVAAEHGAIGCIIYSDPRDDGYAQGETYPKGPWRTQWSAQRGSVIDLPTHTGDPLTPGVGATVDAKRLDRSQVDVLPKIPVLPISWGDAQPLLQAIGGPVAPAEWRGGLPITYRIGPGPARVHLKVAFDWNLVPAYDVIARMAGKDLADEWVIRGNHHDGWVNGADDPISGLVALLAEARAMGSLAKGGWRPRRSIVFAAWDAEEEGMIGSTEWAEEHAADLRKHGVAYINSDTNGPGFLDAGGSPTLEPLVVEVAREVIDPRRPISVADRLRAARWVRGTPDDKREVREAAGFHIDPLGSGSDWTGFLQHVGVASLNLGFGGENEGGTQYHSIYDSFDHYTRFGDPSFEYGVLLARFAGRVVLRLADADILPFAPAAFANTIDRYLKDVRKIADDLRASAIEEKQLALDGVYVAAADPRETYVPRPRPDAVPFLNFAPMLNALERLQIAGRAYGDALSERAGNAPGRAVATGLDQVLMGLERTLLSAEGLPRRPWYGHQIYAPGFYTGYSAKTLPGIREAIEGRQWVLADAQIVATATVLDAFAAQVDRATALLRKR